MLNFSNLNCPLRHSNGQLALDSEQGSKGSEQRVSYVSFKKANKIDKIKQKNKIKTYFLENKITTYEYVFSHTHVTKNDICSAVLVLYCCSQSECSPVLFQYLNRFLIKWHHIVYRWKGIVNVYLMRLFPRLSAIKWKSYIQNTIFSKLLSQISLLFTYQMVCYYMPLESPF